MEDHEAVGRLHGGEAQSTNNPVLWIHYSHQAGVCC